MGSETPGASDGPMSSWTVCVLGSSTYENVQLKASRTATAEDLKSAICTHLVQSSSGRFLALHPNFMELVVTLPAANAEERVVIGEAADVIDLDAVPKGKITAIPLGCQLESAWRPILSGLDDSRSHLELRAIELGGSSYSNCFFYSFIAALEVYIGSAERSTFIARVSNLVAETQEFLASLPEFPDEFMTFEALSVFRKTNEPLNVISEYFDGAVSVWDLRDLVAHRLPEFLRPSFFREGASNPEENYCRWGLHAPAKESLAQSVQWFQWRMRFPWGVFPDAAKLLADILEVPVTMYENRASKGKQYCICTTTRIDGTDLKEAAKDPRFGTGLKLLGMSGHWQLAQVREGERDENAEDSASTSARA
mmetsp:Transcript_166213/g.319234  ORF Transcript_166213/g.319234 Transcript_166213/m.319234 type:complete len:367 (-) Transcript_166213:6-1106(-)